MGGAGEPAPWQPNKIRATATTRAPQRRTTNARTREPIGSSEALAQLGRGGVRCPFRLATGNHWQWELTTGEVPPVVMSPAMTERVPQRKLFVAYVRTLAEVGLLE